MAAQALALSSSPLAALGARSRSPVRALLSGPRMSSTVRSGSIPALLGDSFKGGSPLIVSRNIYKKKTGEKAKSSVRCEQNTKGGSGVDTWLGRIAMIGFASAISTEIATGKGLLENFGLVTPLPTVALGVTGLVGVLTAFFIFQSASRE